MEVLKKQLTLHKKDYYVKHLSIVNVFLPIKMTPKEIEVLAVFMSLEGDIAKQRFGTSARKIIRSTMKISPGGLGNYLKSLKEKGFLKELEPNNFEILSMLHPDPSQQGYMFKLKKVDGEIN